MDLVLTGGKSVAEVARDPDSYGSNLGRCFKQPHVDLLRRSLSIGTSCPVCRVGAGVGAGSMIGCTRLGSDNAIAGPLFGSQRESSSTIPLRDHAQAGRSLPGSSPGMETTAGSDSLRSALGSSGPEHREWQR